MPVAGTVAGKNSGKTYAKKMIAVGGICSTSVFRVPHVPALPAKVIADAMVRVVDGMAISAAYAFVRLGGTAGVWGRVGDDDAGRSMRAALAAEGLDISGVITVPGGRSSQSTVIVDGEGQRLVVPFHDPSLDPSPLALPLAALDTAGIVHCDARWPDGAEYALRAAFACAAASLKCRRFGGWQGCPTRAEVDQALRREQG